jgi:lipid-A-disaccharide synthase
VPFVSLPNLIADKEVVRELLQNDFSVENLRFVLQQLISNPDYRAEVLAGYDEISARVGKQPASATTARLILEYGAGYPSKRA